MDPFNIIIEVNGKKFDLNVHPQEAGSYKIIYHGALIGAIFMGDRGENWEAIDVRDLDPAGYAVYQYDEASEHARFVFDDEAAEKIGSEISRIQKGA